jgi:UDP-N-acetylmuramoyl-L-alanyl-D-glutamate--2,6-diaminopimelate ligase
MHQGKSEQMLSVDRSSIPDEEEVGPPPVRLSELAAAVPSARLIGTDALVHGIAYDSRRVIDGVLFFAMPGTHTDGHQYAAAAVEAGACALVVDREMALGVPELVVPTVRRAIGPVSGAFFGRPSETLRVVGVTGTNGKTTTCTLLRYCLDAAGLPAGQIGTVGTLYRGRSIPTALTTPQAPELQWTLRQMVEAGVRAVAMEASSHGLDQGRLDGIAFDVGVFMNLSREHLDYHHTMEQYFEAKSELFDPARCRRAVIGVDDGWGRLLAERVSVPAVTFGRTDDADVRVDVEELGLRGIEVTMRCADGDVKISSPLIGAVNAANVAAAYLSARALGVASEVAVGGVGSASPPPGRFELVDVGQPFIVVVDYAHTPDALAALIGTSRRIAPGRVSVVLGARGGRDRGKRPLIGEIVASADHVFFTTDSPGDEPIAEIIRALYRGTLRSGRNTRVTVEPDRRRAIEAAVRTAAAGDAVLIVGRGHEQFQRIGEETVQLDDRLAARQALESSLAGPI